MADQDYYDYEDDAYSEDPYSIGSRQTTNLTNNTDNIRDEPLSAADHYRQHYANVPFYGDTTSRSDFQHNVIIPKDPTSQSLYNEDPHSNYEDHQQNNSEDPTTVNADTREDGSTTGTGQYHYADVPFYADTTNRSVYTKKELEPVNNYKPANRVGLTADHYARVPFYGETTNQAEYVPKFVERDSSKPNQPEDNPINYHYDRVPFFGETTNRSHFTQKAGDRATNQRKPDEVPYGRARPASASTTVSTHRSEYGPKQGERSKIHKPVDEKLWKGENFDDQTTNRSVYEPKQGSSRRTNFRPKHSRLLAPDDDSRIENATTNRKIYSPKPLMPRPDAFRPKRLSLGDGEKLDNETVNRVEYVPKHSEKAIAYKPTTTVGFRNGTVHNNTTTGDDYQPWELQKVASFKPTNARMFGRSFDDQTTNRETYIPKQTDACPAELLLRSKSDFRHVFDKDGHRFFQKVVSEKDSFPRILDKRRSSLDNTNTLLRESTKSQVAKHATAVAKNMNQVPCTLVTNYAYTNLPSMGLAL